MPTVLVVEDNWVNRKMCHDLLADQFEVLEAESAAAAQEYLARRLPDLILMDVQLPGMDGLTFTRRLKEDPGPGTSPSWSSPRTPWTSTSAGRSRPAASITLPSPSTLTVFPGAWHAGCPP